MLNLTRCICKVSTLPIWKGSAVQTHGAIHKRGSIIKGAEIRTAVAELKRLLTAVGLCDSRILGDNSA